MAPGTLQQPAPSISPLELSQVLRDYTQVTQRLQQTHEALQHEIARLNRELEHKNHELERRRRLAALGELAAGVAHEVRNPLGAIQLFSGLLRRQLRDEGALRLVERIDAGIRAIEGVVQDALALAPRDCRLTPHRLADLIEQAYQLVRDRFDRHGVRFCADFADPSIAVPCDTRALQRVFVNLLANAAEASAPGTAVRVHAEAAEDDTVVIRVRDQGAGLPADVIDRVFDPFFTTKERGTGLGLAIVHRVVEAHGGTVSAQNRREGGAEFTVRLPSAAGAATRDGPDRPNRACESSANAA